ncbi:MAG: hypothetical protein FWD67_04230 [Betaproteobacteria bacterium]|nr:hypothetical protein [Betaproteobacteria bacterium]
MPPRLGHKSFAAPCQLALSGNAFYAILVHRLAIYTTTSFPHSVALISRASLAVTSLRENLLLQECAYAWVHHTNK